MKNSGRVPQGSVHDPILYSLYINDAAVALETHLALFGQYLYLRDRETWMSVVSSANCNTDSLQWICTVNCGRWRPMKGKLRRSISPEDLRVPDDILQLIRWDILFVNNVTYHGIRWDIPFVNNVTYRGITFYRRRTWRHCIKRTVAKALSTYIKIKDLEKNDAKNAVLVKANRNLTDWQTAIVKGRPVLSAERVSHINKPLNLVLYPRWSLTPRQTGRNITSILVLIFCS
jgi:hypothetical protein